MSKKIVYRKEGDKIIKAIEQEFDEGVAIKRINLELYQLDKAISDLQDKRSSLAEERAKLVRVMGMG